MAHLVFSEMGSLEQEELWLILLNSQNEVLAVRKTYRGTFSTSADRGAELFRAAMPEHAVSVIITHNHPSGDPTPSPGDVRITTDVVQAGELLDVDVLEHVVIGAGARPLRIAK